LTRYISSFIMYVHTYVCVYVCILTESVIWICFGCLISRSAVYRNKQYNTPSTQLLTIIIIIIIIRPIIIIIAVIIIIIITIIIIIILVSHHLSNMFRLKY